MNAQAKPAAIIDRRDLLDPSSPEMAEARREAQASPELAAEFLVQLSKARARHERWVRFAQSCATSPEESRPLATPKVLLECARQVLIERAAYAASPEGKAHEALCAAERKLQALNNAFFAARDAFSRDPRTAGKHVFAALSAADAYSAALSDAAARVGAI